MVGPTSQLFMQRKCPIISIKTILPIRSHIFVQAGALLFSASTVILVNKVIPSLKTTSSLIAYFDFTMISEI